MNIYKSEKLSKIKIVRHGFFDRHDGFSTGQFESLNVGLNRGDENAVKNREKIANYFGIEPRKLVTATQIHSTSIHTITEDNLDYYLTNTFNGDGIVTNVPGILIGVYTADCIPLLMYDESTGFIVAIHCGWRGIFKRMIATALLHMKNLGCKKLTVVSGAFIHKLALEANVVPVEFQGFFKNNVFNLQLLLKTMMKETNFEDLNIDTFSNQNFFSHRRANYKNTGDKTLTNTINSSTTNNSPLLTSSSENAQLNHDNLYSNKNYMQCEKTGVQLSSRHQEVVHHQTGVQLSCIMINDKRL